MPQDVIDLLYEQGALIVGVYCVIARHASKRGQVRLSRERIVADSKLKPKDANAAIDWLWENELLEYHQILNSAGELTDTFFYVLSQDKTRTGGD